MRRCSKCLLPFFAALLLCACVKGDWTAVVSFCEHTKTAQYPALQLTDCLLTETKGEKHFYWELENGVSLRLICNEEGAVAQCRLLLQRLNTDGTRGRNRCALRCRRFRRSRRKICFDRCACAKQRHTPNAAKAICSGKEGSPHVWSTRTRRRCLRSLTAGFFRKAKKKRRKAFRRLMKQRISALKQCRSSEFIPTSVYTSDVRRAKRRSRR